MTYTILSQPSYGTLSGTAPNMTYTPTATTTLTDSFTFEVNNGQLNSPPATVTIGVYSAPSAYGQTLSACQGTPLDIILTGFDPRGLPLTYTITSGPSKGTLTGTAPNVTYTPNATATGTDSFSFTVNDGELTSTPAVVSIGILGQPTANGQTLTTSENTPLAITLTGTDPQGLSLSYNIVTPPANGSLTGTAPNVTYTPKSGYSGTDSFTFAVNNGVGDSAPATISIKVTSTAGAAPPVTAPTANGQTLKACQGTPLAITLAGPTRKGWR